MDYSESSATMSEGQSLVSSDLVTNTSYSKSVSDTSSGVSNLKDHAVPMQEASYDVQDPPVVTKGLYGEEWETTHSIKSRGATPRLSLIHI